MIREATLADIPALIPMGQRFFSITHCAEYTRFDDESFAQTAAQLIESDSGVILVADAGEVVGAVGGMVYPLYFNHAHLTGQEFFWWVEPEHRGKYGLTLLTALEQWAKDKGAESFSMIALEASEPERVGNIYRQAGYSPAEHTWTRRI